MGNCGKNTPQSPHGPSEPPADHNDQITRQQAKRESSFSGIARALIWISAATLILTSTTRFANATPANPVLVGHTPFNAAPLNTPPIEGIDGPYDMRVVGDYAYVANERRGSFAVINISDPTNPTFVTESPRPGLTNARSIAIAGNYAYVAETVENALAIFDISQPSAPVYVTKVASSTILEGAHAVTVAGNYAYVGTSDADSLVVVDVSDKTLPRIVGSTKGPTPGTSLDRVRDVVLSGDYVFAASSGVGGLAIVDVSDPTSPTWKSKASCPGATGVHGVKVVGDHAYIACAAGIFAVVDVTDPLAPVVVGSTRGPQPGETLLGAFHLYVIENYAYVTLSHFSDAGGKVVVIDITDKTNPTVFGETTEVREARAVFAVGTYLYTASDAWDAFMVFDIGPTPPAPPPPPTCTMAANPSTITKGSATLSWTSAGASSGTFVSGGKIYPMSPVSQGSTTVTPSKTATYTGSVADPAGGQPGTCHVVITVIPPPGIVVNPIADTYVAETKKTTSFGASPWLLAKAGTGSRYTYLKFDTSAFAGSVTSAKLRINLIANGTTFPNSGSFVVREFKNSSWTESMTWNTKLPDINNLGNQLASKALPIATNQIMEIDITSYVKAQRAAGSNVMSFTLRSVKATNNSGVLIESREAPVPPQLVIQ